MGFMIPLLIGLMAFAFSAHAQPLGDVDYCAYHQVSFSAGDVLLPATATPERISTAVLSRSAVLGKIKVVDSVNKKVVSAGYKDRPGWTFASSLDN